MLIEVLRHWIETEFPRLRTCRLRRPRLLRVRWKHRSVVLRLYEHHCQHLQRRYEYADPAFLPTLRAALFEAFAELCAGCAARQIPAYLCLDGRFFCPICVQQLSHRSR